VSRQVSAETRGLIDDGGFDHVFVADLMYNGDRRLRDVPITAPELSWDGSANVIGSGSVRVVWSDDHATSLIPRQIGDWFSPFGAQLQIDCIVSSGEFSERIPLGRFVIESVPDAVESQLLFAGRLIHPGESFGLRLKDGLIRVARDRFPFPASPRTTSAWGEITAISGLPVIRNLPDAVVPKSVTYDEDRMQALTQLFDLLGAWPHLNSSGVLTARPKAWPALVGVVTGKVSAPLSMDSEKVYNRVVVEGKSPNGDPVRGIAEVTEGFLRVRNADGSPSPHGAVTYFYSSDMLTTAAQCQAYARELLPRVSRLRGVTREVVETFNPLREVGDVLTLDSGRVRVLRVRFVGATTVSTVEVPDE